MVRTLFSVLFLGSTCAALAQVPPDGFYLRSADESAPFALTQGGTRVSLGPAQEVPIQSSRVYSEDNANSTFRVSVHIPLEGNRQATPYVLVVANRAYSPSGGGSGPGYYAIGFRASGVDNALDISRFLSTPIAYRKHPGHQLLVSFTPVLPSFRIEDDVRVRFRIQNIGTNPISFMQGGHYRGSTRDDQYTFSARLLGKQVQDIGSNIHFGGIAGIRVLKAGDVFEDEVNISKWFAFDKKGSYEVFGSYDLRFHDPANARETVWTDYVSDRFLVKIE
jgi:hypothetical protein